MEVVSGAVHKEVEAFLVAVLLEGQRARVTLIPEHGESDLGVRTAVLVITRRHQHLVVAFCGGRREGF